MNRPSSLKPHQSALFWACALSIALWFVPFLRWITVPIQYFNTHIHEMFHAIVAVSTGGAVSHIEVHANGNGETYTAGGWGLLISSAGYLGASLVGALLIAFAHSAKAAKIAAYAVAVLLTYSMIVWVRVDLFGMVAGLVWIVALGAIGAKLPDDKRIFALQFLGVQQCLNSLQSLLFLVHISGFQAAQSDAKNVESMIGFPAILTALIWSALSLAMMGLALRVGLNSKPLNPTEPEWVR
jgi:hypothetical protein